MRNELEKHYDEFKSVFDVLPIKTKANRAKKLEYLVEEEEKNNKEIKIVLDEIKFRLSVFSSLSMNEDIKTVQDKLATCNISNEWNEYNTPYEKMHLDFYLYQLEKYYKDDLGNVNDCIKKVLASFEKVGIVLTKDDFNYNNYVNEYMGLVISGATNDELKSKFEEIYWKFPEMIKTIQVNFKSIYLRYAKKIEKYYKARKEEFLQKYNPKDIFEMRIKLSKQLRLLQHRDGYLIFDKFKENAFSLSTYSLPNIEKKREIYYSKDSYSYDNLLKLYGTLFEYYLIIKYNYLLNNMKEKLEKKVEFKDSKSKALKEIITAEKKLFKLNKSRVQKGLFKKSDEKWLFKYNEILNDLVVKYDNFDIECFNDLVYSKLSQDSTVLEVFRLITSCYLYFVRETKANDENKSLSDITKEFNRLKADINNKQYTLLNSIALLDRKQMKQVIVDKFSLEGITLNTGQLEDGNISKTMQDINELIWYEDIQASDVDLDDIELYLEFEKMNSKK